MDDPDAPMGTWVHWVVYGIPANMRYLQEGLPGKPVLESGIRQGMNSFKKIGYGGPCPPSGPAHRYVFKLYALNSNVEISPGISKEGLLRAVQDQVIQQAQLTGLFKR
jgi:Raf kinase inhibitor-like YbhB/YbcL family protein